MDDQDDQDGDMGCPNVAVWLCVGQNVHTWCWDVRAELFPFLSFQSKSPSTSTVVTSWMPNLYTVLALPSSSTVSYISYVHASPMPG